MVNNKFGAALICIYLLSCIPNRIDINVNDVIVNGGCHVMDFFYEDIKSETDFSSTDKVDTISKNVIVRFDNSVIDSFYFNIESRAELLNVINNITDDYRYWQGSISFSINKFDIDCDGTFDSIVVNLRNIYVFDERGNIKNKIRDYSSRGLFLRVIPLSFEPEKDQNFTCAQKVLDVFGFNLSINQSGAEQIKWLIKNSTNNRPGRIPSDWIVDFDTAFKKYCSVFPSSVFSELELDRDTWYRDYYGILCDGPYDTQCPVDSLFEKSKGFIFCYHAHNHIMHTYVFYNDLQLEQRIDKSMIKIPVSEELTLYQTAHGVLLQKGDLYRWIYHEDQVERLRWNSIHEVTIPETGQITVFMREIEEFDDLNESAPKRKILTFQLKDFE